MTLLYIVSSRENTFPSSPYQDKVLFVRDENNNDIIAYFLSRSSLLWIIENASISVDHQQGINQALVQIYDNGLEKVLDFSTEVASISSEGVISTQDQFERLELQFGLSTLLIRLSNVGVDHSYQEVNDFLQMSDEEEMRDLHEHDEHGNNNNDDVNSNQEVSHLGR